MKALLLLISLTIGLSVVSTQVMAQSEPDSMRTEYFVINGQKIKAYITKEDTLFIADIDSIQFTAPRKFENREEYVKYIRYKRYAAKVYPYAKQAVRIFREAQFVTRYMDEKSRKKHLKKLQQELEEEFESPIKKLTKTQGKILMKMVERELDTTMYQLIKDTRGTFVASYYGTVARFFDHQLKEGYVEGEDRILDIVLKDFDVSYDIEKAIRKNQREQVPMIPQ